MAEQALAPVNEPTKVSQPNSGGNTEGGPSKRRKVGVEVPDNGTQDDEEDSSDASIESGQCCLKCHDYLKMVAAQQTKRYATMVFHNIRALIQSSVDGCHLCNLILNEISMKRQKELQGQLDRSEADEPQLEASVFWHPETDLNPVLRIETGDRDSVSSVREVLLEIKVRKLDDDAEARRLSKRVQDSTASWETINDIHFWLRECEKIHTSCIARRCRAPTMLPTRLLDVGAFDASSFIHLRNSRQVEPGSKYATLSHCWGQIRPIRLLQANVEEFAEGIAITSLPRTFRDAVNVTRSLGIKYLWVDSLCIVQDSKEDWAAECSRMSTVYAGSFVNIGAGVSTDSCGGLFSARSWKEVTPFHTNLTYQPAGWYDVPVVLSPTGDWQANDITLLGERAWTVQERILAPRTVHFLQHKVVWECTERLATESDVVGDLEQKMYPQVPVLAEPLEVDHQNRPASWDAAFLFRWGEIVNLYSCGSLSFQSDKLIAISGVARYLNDALLQDSPLRYYAGIWSCQFLYQLLWSAPQPGNRPSGYLAPSWSWASYSGAISCPQWFQPGVENEYWAELIHVEVKTLCDPFGTVVSGHVRVRGPLCVARVVQSACEISAVQSSDDTRVSLRLCHSDTIIKFDELTFDESNDNRIEENTEGFSDEVVLLGVIQSVSTSEWPLAGLILRRDGSQRGRYLRIGCFRLDGYSYGPATHTKRQEQQPKPWNSRIRYMYHNGERTAFQALAKAFDALDVPDEYWEHMHEGLYEITII